MDDFSISCVYDVRCDAQTVRRAWNTDDTYLKQQLLSMTECVFPPDVLDQLSDDDLVQYITSRSNEHVDNIETSHHTAYARLLLHSRRYPHAIDYVVEAMGRLLRDASTWKSNALLIRRYLDDESHDVILEGIMTNKNIGMAQGIADLVARSLIRSNVTIIEIIDAIADIVDMTTLQELYELYPDNVLEACTRGVMLSTDVALFVAMHGRYFRGNIVYMNRRLSIEDMDMLLSHAVMPRFIFRQCAIQIFNASHQSHSSTPSHTSTSSSQSTSERHYILDTYDSPYIYSQTLLHLARVDGEDQSQVTVENSARFGYMKDMRLLKLMKSYGFIIPDVLQGAADTGDVEWFKQVQKIYVTSTPVDISKLVRWDNIDDIVTLVGPAYYVDLSTLLRTDSGDHLFKVLVDKTHHMKSLDYILQLPMRLFMLMNEQVLERDRTGPRRLLMLPSMAGSSILKRYVTINSREIMQITEPNGPIIDVVTDVVRFMTEEFVTIDLNIIMQYILADNCVNIADYILSERPEVVVNRLASPSVNMLRVLKHHKRSIDEYIAHALDTYDIDDLLSIYSPEQLLTHSNNINIAEGIRAHGYIIRPANVAYLKYVSAPMLRAVAPTFSEMRIAIIRHDNLVINRLLSAGILPSLDDLNYTDDENLIAWLHMKIMDS